MSRTKSIQNPGKYVDASGSVSIPPNTERGTVCNQRKCAVPPASACSLAIPPPLPSPPNPRRIGSSSRTASASTLKQLRILRLRRPFFLKNTCMKTLKCGSLFKALVFSTFAMILIDGYACDVRRFIICTRVRSASCSCVLQPQFVVTAAHHSMFNYPLLLLLATLVFLLCV